MSSAILYLKRSPRRPLPVSDAPWLEVVTIAGQYEAEALDWSDFCGLIVPNRMDQRHLATLQPRFDAFLDGGGVIALDGQIAYPFITGLAPFEPLAETGLERLIIRRVNDHPVFEGVNVEDLTFRRGVAGFYGRGHSAPPPGATAIHALGRAGAPVDWVWARPAGGVVLMHAGNDLTAYAREPNSAARIAPQLIAWMQAGGRA